MQPTTRSYRWRKPLLTIHIVTTVSVLGADLALLVLGYSGLDSADPLTIYPAAQLVGKWLVAPLAVLSLGTGLLLALLTEWGLLRYWWVTIKLAITAALTATVLFVLLPRLDSTANAVTGPTPRVLSPGDQLPLVIAPALASTLLAVNVALAIFKPDARLRIRVRRAAAPSRRAVQR